VASARVPYLDGIIIIIVVVVVVVVVVVRPINLADPAIVGR